jgi:hypothetical protein
MIYLDSAAIVKLVHAEAESAALRAWLDEAAARLPAVLDQIDLIDLIRQSGSWPRPFGSLPCAAWTPFTSARHCTRATR